MDELTMSVSGICVKNGKRVAYVTFSDSTRFAEGIIPECIIEKQKGFNEEEITQLQLYMKMNLGTLKKQAALINPVKAMLGTENVIDKKIN